MRRASDFWLALIGAALGLAISLFVVVYLPMKANHDECGRVTLCDAQPNPRKPPAQE